MYVCVQIEGEREKPVNIIFTAIVYTKHGLVFSPDSLFVFGWGGSLVDRANIFVPALECRLQVVSLVKPIPLQARGRVWGNACIEFVHAAIVFVNDV